jgi:hypothetical protein
MKAPDLRENQGPRGVTFGTRCDDGVLTGDPTPNGSARLAGCGGAGKGNTGQSLQLLH